jgi:hypothetical protein
MHKEHCILLDMEYSSLFRMHITFRLESQTGVPQTFGVCGFHPLYNASFSIKNCFLQKLDTKLFVVKGTKIFVSNTVYSSNTVVSPDFSKHTQKSQYLLLLSC